LAVVRLGAFSDGILAIAATILIRDGRTPASGISVWSSLQAEWHTLPAHASNSLGIGVVRIHTTTCATKCSVVRTLLLSRTGPAHHQVRMGA